MEEGLDLDAYMSQGRGFGDSSVGIEPGSMAEQGVFSGNDRADGGGGQDGGLGDYGAQMPVLDYQKGQYGINLPITEAQIPLSGGGGGNRQQTNMPAFHTAEERSIQMNMARPRPGKDEHPISIIAPTPSGVQAYKRREKTPANVYQGTILDGIGSSQVSRTQKLTKAQEFAAMAKKDKEMRDAVRAKMIEENADGHYTKQKLAQQAVDRSYRGAPEQSGDRFDSYVDQLGGDASASASASAASRAEIRQKIKRGKQEEYALLLREQQELKKLHDLQSQKESEAGSFVPSAPKGSPSASGRSPPRGGTSVGMATIGSQSPVAPAQMNETQKARYRASQWKYREELDRQIENKKVIDETHQAGRAHAGEGQQRRESADADVRRERDREDSRLQALREIPAAEINEFERKRYQQQKLLVQSLENTTAHLDDRLLGTWNKHAREEAAIREKEGDYFEGMGSYQTQQSDKDRRKAEAEKYQQQLAEDKAKNTITLPRRSLMEKKRDPFASDDSVSVFHASQGPSAPLPTVGRPSAMGSISNGAIGMAPGDLAIIKANKTASQQAYAAMLEEDAQTTPQHSARKSLAAEHRAQRLKEDAPWVAELNSLREGESGGGVGGGTDQKYMGGRTNKEGRRAQQAQWASDLARDQQVRDQHRREGGEEHLYSPRLSARERAAMKAAGAATAGAGAGGGDGDGPVVATHSNYQEHSDSSKFFRTDFASPTKSHSHATYSGKSQAMEPVAAGSLAGRSAGAATWNEETTDDPSRYYNASHDPDRQSHSHRTYKAATVANRDHNIDSRNYGTVEGGQPAAPSEEPPSSYAPTTTPGHSQTHTDGALHASQLDQASLSAEDREALEAYEEYMRKMVREEAMSRMRIQRGGTREEMARALYDDPFAQR